MGVSVLQRPTLVLNRHWQPVHVATVARSLVLLWNQAAHVVDPDDFQLYSWADWAKLAPRDDEPFIRTVRFRMRVPEVLTLTRHDRPRYNTVTFSRRNLFKRDHATCQYCGVEAGDRGADHRPRRPPRRARPDDLGELRAGLRRLQFEEGEPHARRGLDEAPPPPVPPDLEAAVRRLDGPDRKLVAVPQRRLLERPACSTPIERNGDPSRPALQIGKDPEVIRGERVAGLRIHDSITHTPPAPSQVDVVEVLTAYPVELKGRRADGLARQFRRRDQADPVEESTTRGVGRGVEVADDQELVRGVPAQPRRMIRTAGRRSRSVR